VSIVVRVSVVIPTYRRRASLQRTLEAFRRQTIPPTEYEVIVAVDGSEDGTREMVASFQAPYHLVGVWQPNTGRAAACNAGIARAHGDLVVLLDDDMEPVPEFLAAHLDAHPPGSRRAVVGPVPIPEDPADQPIVEYRRRGMQALQDRFAQPGYRLRFRDVYTGNCSVPRDVLRELGGFDTTFTLYGHEDYELALRLANAGVELAYSPRALAYQRYEKDFPAMARDCIARGHTAVLFARKHPDAAAGLRLGSYAEASRKWRLLRALLLWLSAVRSDVPEGVIRLMTWLERRRPSRLDKYYALAIDYFFWLGVRAARAGGEPATRHASTVPLGMQVAAGLLVLFSVTASGRLLIRAFRDLPAIGRPDEITLYESRFHGLRQVLLPHGQVGYVADSAAAIAEDSEHPGRADFKRYLLTQYALLPTLVRPDTRQPLVVGNFASVGQLDSGAARGLTQIRNFGNGVVLFRTAPE
jgi:GT2 family glycosyltransferase